MKICLLILIIIIIIIFNVNVENFSDNKINFIQLILYSEGKDYNNMYELTSEYYRKFNNVKTYYYKFSPDVKKVTIDRDFILIPGNESYVPGILDKTIKAFEFTNNNMTFDYIIRSNISSVVNFDILSNYLVKNPVKYGGPGINVLSWLDHSSGVIDDTYFGTPYVSGTCIVISKKTIEDMLNNKEHINYKLIDDLSIGVLIKERLSNITPINMGHFIMVNNNVDIDNIITNGMLYRNRSSADRSVDVENIKYVTNQLDNNFVFPYQKINQIYCINGEKVLKEFEKIDIPKNIIINVNNHISALEHFIKSKKDICIIFEDSFKFTLSKIEIIKKLNEIINNDFNICLLTTTENNKSNFMVSKKFAQTILDELKNNNEWQSDIKLQL